MGGLKKYMPVTFCGLRRRHVWPSRLPAVLSGFWSKDKFSTTRTMAGSQVPFYLGCCGALFTAFYMTRQSRWFSLANIAATRKNPPTAIPRMARTRIRISHSHDPHESPAVMTVPLVILACSHSVGRHRHAGLAVFDKYMNGELAELKTKFGNLSETAGLMGISALIVIFGITVGVLL